MDVQRLMDLAKSVARQRPEIALLYLFGSQVTGSTGELSDIDLGILVDSPAFSPDDRFLLEHEFSIVLRPERVDLVVLNTAPVELAYHVITHGTLLYQRSLAEKVEYESNVLSSYFDYFPVLCLFRKEILEGGKDDKRVQRYREAFRRTERTLGEITASRGKDKG
jgi:predicted nucleotidyltransferase